MAAIRGDVEETGNPELAGRVIVPCERTIVEPARYSPLYLGRGEMIEHVLAKPRACWPSTAATGVPGASCGRLGTRRRPHAGASGSGGTAFGGTGRLYPLWSRSG